MEIRKAKLVYYSPTGTGKTMVTAIMNGTDLDYDIIDLTPPDSEIKKIRCILRFLKSVSKSSTFLPARAKLIAKLVAVEVLPSLGAGLVIRIVFIGVSTLVYLIFAARF